MCGICGILDLRGNNVSAEELKAMSNVLRHRGPDDQGRFFSGPLAFGFRRLSIVDLAGGHQPMTNEDGSVWIVFNGEIYNHAELRPGLQKRGHRFASNSDTETIVHLYEEYGDDCVCHLRGMFAFSSEIKALLELQGFRPRLSRDALPEFFAFGYLSSQETLFADVYKLLPGHRFYIGLATGTEKPEISQYWDLNISPPEYAFSESDYVSQFRDLFTETVRAHLMSDVLVGVFLSGGLDSSSIAAVMAALKKEPIQTFSVGYAEGQYSELPHAREVARHIGAEYNQVILGPEDFFASLPQLIWHEDE